MKPISQGTKNKILRQYQKARKCFDKIDQAQDEIVDLLRLMGYDCPEIEGLVGDFVYEHGQLEELLEQVGEQDEDGECAEDSDEDR